VYKFSATQWIFGKEPLEDVLERLKRYGYDGVELTGIEEDVDPAETLRLLDEYGLECTSICGTYPRDRDLASPNEAKRRRAVEYVKRNVDFAAATGAALVIVVPTPIGKSGPESTREEEWALAVDSLKKAGAYAAARGVVLAVEALNRFETYLVNTLEAAKSLVEQVDMPSVRLMADVFHMNIEERSLTEALRSVAPHLAHVHIADNTREAAGLGTIDFRAVMATLRDIGYRGAIAMEFMPRVANPYLSAEQGADAERFDEAVETSIRHVKAALDDA